MTEGTLPPLDPMTELAQGAAHCHELYETYVSVGFSESAALYLVGCILSAAVRSTPPQPS